MPPVPSGPAHVRDGLDRAEPIGQNAVRKTDAGTGAGTWLRDAPVIEERWRTFGSRHVTGAGELGTPIRILVVDDQSDLRLLIRLTLSGPGFSVAEAAGGVAALASCEDSVPDACLVDVMMPDIDGYSLCRRLRADRRFDRSAIILMTAGDQATERANAADCGADHYLPKPFRPSELPALVARAVSAKRGTTN